jgi:hypothetical protein
MSAARSTSGSFDAASAGRDVPCSAQPESLLVMLVLPTSEIIRQIPQRIDSFFIALTADAGIVQKSQIALVRTACDHVARTTHHTIALLPDCERMQRSSELHGPRGRKQGGQS